MTKDRDALLEKIRKLLALAGSPNQAEAESAAAKAQELLAAYNLDMADVLKTGDRSEIKEEIFEEGRCSKAWREVLLNGICAVTFCKMLRGRGSNGEYNYSVLGREHCIATARCLYEYLAQAAMRLGRRHGGTTRDIANFRMGFAAAIRSRLWIQYEEQIKGREEKALVIQDSDLIDKMLSVRGVRRVSLRTGRRNSNAYAAGYAAGRDLSLAKQVGESGAAGSLEGAAS